MLGSRLGTVVNIEISCVPRDRGFEHQPVPALHGIENATIAGIWLNGSCADLEYQGMLADFQVRAHVGHPLFAVDSDVDMSDAADGVVIDDGARS